MQNELRRRFDWDAELRGTCLENLRQATRPGYRSTDILPWLCGEGRLKVSQQQGLLLPTNCAEDLALEGEGYFMLPDGAWTRAVQLREDRPLAEKWLGDRFETAVTPLNVPEGAASLEVRADGVVSWVELEGDGKPVAGYRLRLAWADQVGRRGYLVQPLSTAQFGHPGEAGLATVVQGSLEMSNEDGYQRRIVGAALMEWAGLPLFPDQPADRKLSPPAYNPYPALPPQGGGFHFNPTVRTGAIFHVPAAHSMRPLPPPTDLFDIFAPRPTSSGRTSGK